MERLIGQHSKGNGFFGFGPQAKFVNREHARWRHGDVLFVTLNVPGNANNARLMPDEFRSRFEEVDEAGVVHQIEDWRGGPVNQENAGLKEFDEAHFLIKEEKMPDGKLKIILKDKQTGKVSQIIQ